MERSLQRDLGVYIHFPWCRALCPYCDFPVLVARAEPPHRAYLDAVLGELDQRGSELAGRTLCSIYLGGGTPSLWDPACIAELIARVAAHWHADPSHLEITLETNPIDCSGPRMAAWRAGGVNRLSIGVQSWEAADLAALGRDHAMGDGPAAIEAAAGAGFAVISADLMLGAPGVSRDPHQAPSSVGAAIDSGVAHVSVYELTIEPATTFGKRVRAGTLPVLPDDDLAQLYEATHHALTAAGFEHYEVSSYARPGRRAVHNSLYWQGAEYLGLGLGAASYLRDPDGGGAVRQVNSRQLARYLGGGAARVAERTPLTAHEVATDELWLAMRTSVGAPAAALGAVATWMVAAGLGEIAGDRVHPTLRGFLFADQIAARVVSMRAGPS